MEFTPLEKDVLNWIGDHTKNLLLAKQIRSATVISREFTGVGSFTKLVVSGETLPHDFREPTLDPLIESPELENGATAVLFFENGCLSLLELVSFAGAFPETLNTWKLTSHQ